MMEVANAPRGQAAEEQSVALVDASTTSFGTPCGLSRRLDNLILRSLVQAVGERADDALFTPGDVAEWFGVSDRTAREWLVEWRDQGHIEPASGHKRVRVWRLAGKVGEAARGVLAELIAEPRSGERRNSYGASIEGNELKAAREYGK